MEDTILVITAHDDDAILGMGGTIAKYKKEGKKVVVVVFSYGEKSDPWLKEKVIAETRKKEMKKACEFLGVDELFYLGLKEGRFMKDFKENHRKLLLDLIKKNKVSKIFTHSSDDHHIDHKAVNRLIISLCKKSDIRIGIFTFEVWTLFKLKTNMPHLYVDISDTFKKKIEALKVFRSQARTLVFFEWIVYFKAFFNGLKNHCKFSEKFVKAM